VPELPPYDASNARLVELIQTSLAGSLTIGRGRRAASMRTDVHEPNTPPLFSAALGYATHEVLNQPGSLADYDAYSDDKPLVEAVTAFDGGWTEQRLRRAGIEVGSAKVQQLARLANRNLPELRTHDRFGNRIDV